jgi:hypothetical protein
LKFSKAGIMGSGAHNAVKQTAYTYLRPQ